MSVEQDSISMAAWSHFNAEDRYRQDEVAKILRASFEAVWDGTYDHVASKIVIALRSQELVAQACRDGYRDGRRERDAQAQPPPPEFRFAEAFQSLTMRCLGYDAEIKALMRDVRALQDRVHEHEEFPELEPK